LTNICYPIFFAQNKNEVSKMITNKQLYDGLTRARMVYGHNELHIQLVAKQMGVLASDIAEYLIANPTLVTHREVIAGQGNPNPAMGEEYSGTYISNVTLLPYLETESKIVEGANGGTIVVTLTGGTFETAAGTASNWTVDVGLTGLTFASVAKNSSSQCTLTFTGTAALGTISIMAENAATTASVDSDTLSFDITAASLSYATVTSLITRLSALESVVGAEGGASDLFDRIIALETASSGLVDIKPSAGKVTEADAEEGSIELGEGISLHFTNKVKGDNSLTINLITPEEDAADEVVEVGDNEINVTLAYNTGAITSTAAQVKAAIEATPAAHAMVAVAITGLNSTLAIEDSVVLSGGVDGTAAEVGKILIGGTSIAIAETECTAQNTDGWKIIEYTP
jgi:hypothetical protein